MPNMIAGIRKKNGRAKNSPPGGHEAMVNIPSSTAMIRKNIPTPRSIFRTANHPVGILKGINRINRSGRTPLAKNLLFQAAHYLVQFPDTQPADQGKIDQQPPRQ